MVWRHSSQKKSEPTLSQTQHFGGHSRSASPARTALVVVHAVEIRRAEPLAASGMAFAVGVDVGERVFREGREVIQGTRLFPCKALSVDVVEQLLERVVKSGGV